MHNIVIKSDNNLDFFKKTIFNYPSQEITVDQLSSCEYSLSGKDEDTLKLKISDILTEYILTYCEEILLQKLISSDYPYFENLEKKSIADKAVELLAPLDNDFFKTLIILKRRFLIKQDILDFLSENSSLNINGFVNFRLTSYKALLSDLLEKVVKDYKLQKEYMDFITMLKFFVDTQKNRCNKLHVIFEISGKYTILDENNLDITKKCFDEFLEVKGNTLNNEDLLLSSLITLAPKKIFLHFECDNYNKKIVKTIEQIFESKVFSKSVPALEVVR